jgi:hypothetical protein
MPTIFKVFGFSLSHESERGEIPVCTALVNVGCRIAQSVYFNNGYPSLEALK